jgi:peptidoglycan L-alanyl-D-glutamate endopeptidase CwlK
MDPHSEAFLSGVNPTLSALVHAAASALQAQGTYVCVYQGYRTAVQQNALYAQGRTAPGHVVTDARAGYSNHNYGLAVDAVPYLSTVGGALNWNIATPQFQAMVAALKAQGLAYGGDWKTFPDDDHFQMSNMPASPSPAMIADFTAGHPLQLMWTNYAGGLYVPSTPSLDGIVDA